MLVLLAAVGCGGYGEVSPAAYQYAKAMTNIAGRQAEGQLDKFVSGVTAARDAGELTEREAGWLNAMADDARRGDWQSALTAARRMMQDQVR